MKIAEKTLEFDKSLWVQYDGVDVDDRGATLAVTGRDEDSYLKVLNHFGRLLKLYTFEGGRWVDADTGAAPLPLDDAEAGHLPGTRTDGEASAGTGAGARAGSKPGRTRSEGKTGGAKAGGTKGSSTKAGAPKTQGRSTARGRTGRSGGTGGSTGSGRRKGAPRSS